LTKLLKKLGKEMQMRMSGSQLDQEIAGLVGLRVGPTDLDTPPTQELPVELADLAPTGLSRARRRYRALVAAVRDHERGSSHPAVPKRPADHALYGALNEVESFAPAPGDLLR
jgi:hypothetical protein